MSTDECENMPVLAAQPANLLRPGSDLFFPVSKSEGSPKPQSLPAQHWGICLQSSGQSCLWGRSAGSVGAESLSPTGLHWLTRGVLPQLPGTHPPRSGCSQLRQQSSWSLPALSPCTRMALSPTSPSLAPTAEDVQLDHSSGPERSRWSPGDSIGAGASACVCDVCAGV